MLLLTHTNYSLLKLCVCSYSLCQLILIMLIVMHCARASQLFCRHVYIAQTSQHSSYLYYTYLFLYSPAYKDLLVPTSLKPTYCFYFIIHNRYFFYCIIIHFYGAIDMSTCQSTCQLIYYILSRPVDFLVDC